MIFRDNRSMNFQRSSCKQTEQTFFWHVLSPDSAQFKRGTGVLGRFSRFVTVGLGNVCMFARYFSNLHETTLFAFCGMCFISTKFKQPNGS